MAKKRKRRRRRSSSSGGASADAPTAERDNPADTNSGERPAAPTRRANDPPPPPWGSFPLSELVIFVGIVFLIAGFFIGPPQGTVTLVVGLALASLGGLELAIREHFAGYRSHTLLLGGAAGIAVLALLLALRLGPAVAGAAGIVVFSLCAWLLLGQFRRRSGGELYRIR